MIWKIILLITIFLLIILIPIKIRINFNVLKLSGVCELQIFNIIKFKIRTRIRGRYIYITQKGRTRREMLSSKNYNIALILKLINEIYFRTELNYLHLTSEIGYYNDAMISSLGCSIVDILTKCAKARILHNKKSAHIFICNDAKYNQDCLNINLECRVKISIFDVLYSFANSYLSLKGERYERNKAEYEQDK